MAWKAKKVKKVAKSTLAAETVALVEAVDIRIYLSDTLTRVIYHGNVERIDHYII